MNSPTILRSDDLKAENRHRVLHTLRDQGPLSRAEVGEHTGLSQAALSTLFGAMTEQGIVTSENQSAAVQKRGRPKTTVALDANAGMVVTVALTVDQLSFCLVNYAGATLAKNTLQLDTVSLTTKQLFKQITTGVVNALAPHDISSLKAISIGFQGVADAASKELIWSPILSVENVPIGRLLESEFGVPITLNNDCSLIAKALHKQQRKSLGDSFAAVLFSHGIGLGLYLAGSPFNGAHSSALELGHVQFIKDGALCRCGKRGCIEAYAADYAILRSANNLSPDNIPSGPISDGKMAELIIAANTGGKSEQQAFELAGRAIGFGLATVFTLLDPIPVALIGHNSDAVDLMRKEIEVALNTVGRSPNNYSHLLHCFHEDTPLLLDGLVLEAMLVVDRVFAENASNATSEEVM